jgi:tRNA(Ile)-lysidine synthase|tara:strand:- start:277 stop:969 length:693 start_codon:yes stop_codon:yes gene_type:complete
MIKLLGRVPDTLCVAVSGGSDSMAALNFVLNNSRRKVVALHFNHGTKHSDDAEAFVRGYCRKNGIPVVIGRTHRDIEKGESREAYWRSERYRFFGSWTTSGELCDTISKWSNDSFTKYFLNAPIITCHHLDDAVETWIFTSLHGKSRLIPYKRDNFIRPFLLNRKSEFDYWCDRYNIPYISDPSNTDTAYMRNFIRHELMPQALTVNPGLHKVVMKKIMSSHREGFVDTI